MSTIPASSLVAINPGVLAAGGDALALNGVCLTENTRVPISPLGLTLSFPNATAVGTFFGLNSNEYAEAQVYFAGFTNRTAVPAALLFAQYPASAVPAWLQGGSLAGLTESQWQAITGSLTVVMDGYSYAAASIVLASDTSLSAVAATLQSGLNAALPAGGSCTQGTIASTVLTVGGTVTGNFAVGQLVTGTGVTAGTKIVSLGTGTGGAGTYNLSVSSTVSSEAISSTVPDLTVAYDSVSGGLIVTSGSTGAGSRAAFATGTAAAALNLTQATGATLSQGAAATTPAAFMTALTQYTQDWASFFTGFDPDGGTGNTLKKAFAAWNATQNDRWAYIAWDTDITPTESTNAATSLGQYLITTQGSGTIAIYQPTNLHLGAFVAGMIASINFNATQGRITLAFKGQSGLVPSVTNGTVAANLLANGYNFYGEYSTAAQSFNFFQPGSISGAYKWADAYIDQIWLNNALQLAIMTGLGQVNSVPYNTAGNALIKSFCQDPINAAVTSGVIQPGIALSAAQIEEINTAAGNTQAAGVVQSQGWYLQIQASSAQTRSARQSPPINLWYTDGGSVQQIALSSIDVQ